MDLALSRKTPCPPSLAVAEDNLPLCLRANSLMSLGTRDQGLGGVRREERLEISLFTAIDSDSGSFTPRARRDAPHDARTGCRHPGPTVCRGVLCGSLRSISTRFGDLDQAG